MNEKWNAQNVMQNAHGTKSAQVGMVYICAPDVHGLNLVGEWKMINTKLIMEELEKRSVRIPCYVGKRYSVKDFVQIDDVRELLELWKWA